MNTTEALIVVVLAVLFRPLIKPFLYTLAKFTKTDLDDKIIEAVANPLWFIVLLYAGNYLLTRYADFTYVNYVSIGIHSLIAVFFGVIAVRLTKILVFDVFGRSKVGGIDEKTKNTALIVLYNIAYVVIAVAVLFYILSAWGVDITPLLASAGIAGLAVGLALKDPLENLFYGIVLALDRNFRVGDAVDVGGISGVVEEIGLRNTKIRTWDGNLVLIPNAQVANSKITNFEFPDERIRTSIVIGVSYDSDPDNVKQTLLDIARKHPKVLDDPEPNVLFIEFGESALIFKLMFWTKRADKWATLDEINTAIVKTFREKGIEIPYPITEVHLKKMGAS